ncbi:hypothetical protein D3C72_1090390 [compost metagenome]
MGNRSCAFRTGDIDHTLRNQWARDTCTEQILTFILGTRLEHRVDEVLGELIAQIIDIHFGGAGSQRFCLQPVQLVLLTNIRRERDNLGIIGLLQPL